MSEIPLTEAEIEVELANALKDLINFHEKKETTVTSASIPLKKIFKCLEQLKYTKRDLMVALGVESLTIDRWLDGKGMNPTTYDNFKEVIGAIVEGKPQRSINISQTGFVTWRYVFEQEQPKKNRIWYLTSSPFMSSTSPTFKMVATNLFLAEKQQKENRPKPTLIYLYPRGSEAAASMDAWRGYLEAVHQRNHNLRGTVIGIGVDTAKFPWFMPATRTVIFEKHHPDKSLEVEGYIRIKLEKNIETKLLEALAPKEEHPRAPWLKMEKTAVTNWHILCEAYFAPIIDKAIKKQNEQEKPEDKQFRVHMSKTDD